MHSRGVQPCERITFKRLIKLLGAVGVIYLALFLNLQFVRCDPQRPIYVQVTNRSWQTCILEFEVTTDRYDQPLPDRELTQIVSQPRSYEELRPWRPAERLSRANLSVIVFVSKSESDHPQKGRLLFEFATPRDALGQKIGRDEPIRIYIDPGGIVRLSL